MKPILALVPALFSLSALAAEPAGFQLSVTVDRPDALYAIGETVDYTISLSKDGKPVDAVEVSWTLSKDGVPPNENGSAKLVGGKAKASGTLAEPASCFAAPASARRHSLRRSLPSVEPASLPSKSNLPCRCLMTSTLSGPRKSKNSPTCQRRRR